MKRSHLAVVAGLLAASSLQAQWRVGSDSATRLTRFGRALVYGTAEGLAFAGVDQWRDDPEQWGDGWKGYGKRAASNVGEFVIQEGVTEGLAALMQRPLDYKRCTCKGTGARIGHALRGAVTDEMPDGSHPIALPRIAGAYVGSFAQAAWRPPEDRSVVSLGLGRGTTSLGIGALINLFYEFR